MNNVINKQEVSQWVFISVGGMLLLLLCMGVMYQYTVQKQYAVVHDIKIIEDIQKREDLLNNISIKTRNTSLKRFRTVANEVIIKQKHPQNINILLNNEELQLFKIPIKRGSSKITKNDNTTKNDNPKSDSIKNDNPKSDSIKNDNPKSDSIKSDNPKSDSIKSDSIKSNKTSSTVSYVITVSSSDSTGSRYSMGSMGSIGSLSLSNSSGSLSSISSLGSCEETRPLELSSTKTIVPSFNHAI